MTHTELIKEIIRTTQPLEQPRGDRLPLYLWPMHGLGTDDEAEAIELMEQLDQRGIAVLASWPGDMNEDAMDRALWLGRLQKRLGQPIGISATSCTYSFCNGDTATAHVDAQGKPFFDESFAKGKPMGCPFALDFRLPEMRGRVAAPVEAYKEAGLDIHFVYADWEIDGPIEWNGAWEHSRRCTRCREHIPDIEDFTAFQTALRIKRSELQKAMLAEPVLEHFPDALVGNYAVYPDDGYRYWFDYFEKDVEDAPHKTEHRARYRQWFDEFGPSGYSFAMPVVYTWDYIFNWYNYENLDYRWFYNMLLVGSNSGQFTPAEIPIIGFVHWHTIVLTEKPDPGVKQFSEEKYQELLWHLLLRGHDTFFMWSPRAEGLKESQLLHHVYAASHPYREYLAQGEPVTFQVPTAPGPVVSAVKLGSRLLVRRTDFDARMDPVSLAVGDRTIEVPRRDGECQVIDLK